MTPRGVANIVRHLRLRIALLARRTFLDEYAAQERFGQLAYEADGVDEGGQILPRLVVALVEVMKIDPRRSARIGGPQFDSARAIDRMGLQHRPGHHVVIALQPGGEMAEI